MDEKEKLQALERDKERKISHYMELQDKADAVNEEIYKLCCDIETLNVQIAAVQAELKKTAGGKPPLNGASKPANGKHAS